MKKTKTLLTTLLLFICLFQATNVKAQTYIKGNLPLAAVLIPNIAVETSIGGNWSFQTSATASFWESVNGGPQKFFFLITEFRYHLKAIDEGFFGGLNVGGANFKMQKYNYWDTDKYQVGYAYLGGISIGYNHKLNDKWGLEVFIGGGFIGSYYRGFLLSTGEQYDRDEAQDWGRHFDISGDWLPYEGGLMLTYKL
ncbi:hypothetical protein NBRC110019_21810 [Neptunitalea chrysea]|uniref:DUF3575 domain-containing protein n=1 Tax=Neptunitalea chrysea TaxID=1647581 RepID=A0A9W6B5Y5_9FLAO|nr:DUF3575 domain-containing protein [Neptunitalea chrysea]GLB53141.1 hypothetical protein NBRC110019_21810 [Neptunitalea chrysea]